MPGKVVFMLGAVVFSLGAVGRWPRAVGRWRHACHARASKLVIFTAPSRRAPAHRERWRAAGLPCSRDPVRCLSGALPLLDPPPRVSSTHLP